MLRLENFSVFVEDKEVVKNINLEMKEGIYAITGPNGSGKTTLLKGIIGLLKTSGKIYFYEKEINKLSPQERFKLGISLMHQNPPKINISVKKLLEKVSKIGWEEIEYLAERLKIEKLLERKLFYGFSGGEKKKVEFLISISSLPKLLLMDEPDSGVDEEGIKEIASIIKELKINAIIVTHTKFILKYLKARRIFKMEGGKLCTIS